jgi:anti-sigma regulatory factor (Ser/Thr protein kinase)
MDVRIKLEQYSVPDSVALVRSVIRSIGASACIDERVLEDTITAVSEACNNVVLHAYPLGRGPLMFSLVIRGRNTEAVVRDCGCGMRRPSTSRPGLGMGVALISELADQAQFKSDACTGTEVRMTFGRSASGSIPARALEPAARIAELPDRAELSPASLEVWTLSDLGVSAAPQVLSG